MTENELWSLHNSHPVHDWYYDEFTRGAYSFFWLWTVFVFLWADSEGGSVRPLLIAAGIARIYHCWIFAA